MAFTLPLDSMSITEKLQVMEVLWEDLSKHSNNIEAASWHQELLLQREQAIEKEEDSFLDWDVAKKQILNKISYE
jgi:Putative addiction module component